MTYKTCITMTENVKKKHLVFCSGDVFLSSKMHERSAFSKIAAAYFK
jgi:hypothetical protein